MVSVTLALTGRWNDTYTVYALTARFKSLGSSEDLLMNKLEHVWILQRYRFTIAEPHARLNMATIDNDFPILKLSFGN
jgi:hypothetical protein